MKSIKERTEAAKDYRKEVERISDMRTARGGRTAAIQTAGDILLGWAVLKNIDGSIKDYYVRQLWDSKGTFDLENISQDGYYGLSLACAWTLTHAHAKTGDRHAIAAYLGKGDAFETAMVSYARAYADQNEADYEMFLKIKRSGIIRTMIDLVCGTFNYGVFEDMTAIRMNVDNFEEAYDILSAHGFRKALGIEEVDLETTRALLMVSPSGFAVRPDDPGYR